MKTPFFFFAFLILLYSASANAQCTGPITLTSQAEVNAFPATHSCTEIIGDLSISGNDITNLDSLYRLTTVGGLLTIGNNAQLTNLDGLSALDSVGISLNGFMSIVITGNPALVSIRGLRSLRSTPGTLQIENNISLPNLDGLESLTQIGSLVMRNVSLFINGNTALANINSLSALHSVGGYYLGLIDIESNPALTNVNGLSSLKTITGGVNAGLTLINNSSLTNTDGLSSFTKFTASQGIIRIIDNTNLIKGCALYTILNNSNTPGSFVTVNITGNGAGFTKEEIITAGPCQPVATAPCAGSISFTSQAQVDAFATTYSCTEITGDVVISGNDITNLNGLTSLIKVDGNLIIYGNAQLHNLNGLGGLNSIGGMLEIVNNALVSDLDGLSALTSIGYWNTSYQSISITDNPTLTSVKELKAITSVPGRLQIENNVSLPNLDGLESLTTIGLTGGPIRVADLRITGNTSLTNIDGLSALHTIEGYYIASVTISNNSILTNLNGLSSLTEIVGGIGASIAITDNASLTNVDSLSSLVTIYGATASVIVTNNPNLSKGCGLYPILHNSEVRCPSTAQECIVSTMSGNGAGFSKAEILAGGPCSRSVTSAQPTNLLITAVTAHSMNVSFTAATIVPSGYLTLLRAYGSPYPADAPVDGTVYHVGNTIGSSTIVVGVGTQTSFKITSLISNTNYYLDVFSYNSGYDYLTVNPLAGSQQTTIETTTPPSDPAVQPSNMLFSNVTTNSMTVSFTAPAPVPTGYLTLMRAFSSPFPEDVPVNGTPYSVGGVIGSSTIVVGLGSSTSLNIVYLIPGMDYYFTVYSYHHLPEPDGFVYVAIPLEGNQSTAFNNAALANHITPYPNPFTEEITIPFTITAANTHVEIAIHDSMGKKVANVVSQQFDSGYHEVIWDRTDSQGNKVGNGLYVFNIKLNDSHQNLHGMVVAK